MIERKDHPKMIATTVRVSSASPARFAFRLVLNFVETFGASSQRQQGVSTTTRHVDLRDRSTTLTNFVTPGKRWKTNIF